MYKCIGSHRVELTMISSLVFTIKPSTLLTILKLSLQCTTSLDTREETFLLIVIISSLGLSLVKNTYNLVKKYYTRVCKQKSE